MEVIFPDEPGSTGALLIGPRRRPGSAPGPSSIETTFTVVFKRPYTVRSSNVAGAGSLAPRPDGPGLFDGDAPGPFLTNGTFDEGLIGWTEHGGADATAGDGSVAVRRSGGPGSLRADADLGRSLRERTVGLTVAVQAGEGLATPQPSLVADGETSVRVSGPASFPAEGDQPVSVAARARFSAAVTARAVSTRLPTLDIEGASVTYADVVVSTVEYESDLVAWKPHADLIVIADGPPVPVDVAVNGVVRMSQAAIVPQELTGLGWEDRVGTPREAEGGDFTALTQALPDAFENSYWNGHRRNRRQGATVPYPGPGDEILVRRAGGELYGFTLPAGRPTAQHSWSTGSGQDHPSLWRSRLVTMDLDTLVVEPDRHHAYAVWRAAWPVDLDPDGTGAVPFDRNRRVTVTVAGGG